MDDDDKIKRDIESPFQADDHTTPVSDDTAADDDINDDFGREISNEEPISTHPTQDTGLDSTEKYQEQDLKDFDDEDEELFDDDLDEDEE